MKLIGWKIQTSDFKSASTQIGNVKVYSLFNSCGPEFSFYMSNMEFMFTKNFNSKVNCKFKKNSSALVAPDSAIAMDLLAFAQYQFDLSELCARKFRKKIFDEKATFSDVSFIKPIFDNILIEYSERSTKAGKETDLGIKKDELKILQDDVLLQIQELSEFCKECKPSKKKK